MEGGASCTMWMSLMPLNMHLNMVKMANSMFMYILSQFLKLKKKRERIQNHGYPSLRIHPVCLLLVVTLLQWLGPLVCLAPSVPGPKRRCLLWQPSLSSTSLNRLVHFWGPRGSESHQHPSRGELSLCRIRRTEWRWTAPAGVEMSKGEGCLVMSEVPKSRELCHPPWRQGKRRMLTF